MYPLAYGRGICLCIRRVWWYMSLIWQHYYCSVMPIRPTIKKEKSFPYRCVKARIMEAWCQDLKFLTAQNNVPITYVSKSYTYVFWEGYKILRNLHKLFVLFTASQIIGGDFAKFCGLFRMYELYIGSLGHWMSVVCA